MIKYDFAIAPKRVNKFKTYEHELKQTRILLKCYNTLALEVFKHQK
jgi:hypothetical protein